MKNLFLSLAFMLIGSLSFANNSVVKTVTKKAETKVVKMTYYTVRCNGVIRGYFACDGCDAQAVANAMCG